MVLPISNLSWKFWETSLWKGTKLTTASLSMLQSFSLSPTCIPTFSHERRDLEVHDSVSGVVSHVVLLHVVKLYSFSHVVLLLCWRRNPQEGAQTVQLSTSVLQRHARPLEPTVLSFWDLMSHPESSKSLTPGRCLPPPYPQRTDKAAWSDSVSSPTSRSHGHTRNQTPLKLLVEI